MKAVKFQEAPGGGPLYSAVNPAPSSAIEIAQDVPRPQPSKPGELLVQVKATTVIRDNLTWPELYADPPAQLGNDFSGIVVSVLGDGHNLKPGDEVYGMISAHRGGTWAEYALATAEEAYTKPDNLSWEEAATLPLSALTADQALFDQAGLDHEPGQSKRVLITGASGGVGMFLVQFAAIAGHYVVAATSSNDRNRDFLTPLGAKDLVEYSQLHSLEGADVVIDTVGGSILSQCWSVVKDGGSLVSIDSSSWDFVKQHKEQGLSKGKEDVHALFFIVEPSRKSMLRISKAVTNHGVKGLVAKSMPMVDAKAAYELGHTRNIGRGKVVIVP